jgi:hypothetical protein
MASRQLNVRLDPAAMDELEAHAYLRRIPATTMARDVILEFLRAASDEPGLETARQARVEYDRSAHPPGTVAKFLPHRHVTSR